MLERTIRSIVEGQDVLAAPAKTSVSEAARMMRQRQVGACWSSTRTDWSASSPSATACIESSQNSAMGAKPRWQMR